MCDQCYRSCSCLGVATHKAVKESVLSNEVYSVQRVEYHSSTRGAGQRLVIDAILEVCALIGDEMPHVFVTNPLMRRRGKRVKGDNACGAECEEGLGDQVDAENLWEAHVEEEGPDSQGEDGDVEEEDGGDKATDAEITKNLNEELGKNLRNLVKIPAALYGDKKELYKDLVRRGKFPERLKYKTFVRYWLRHLWHVVISSWQPFAKCDICLSFQASLLIETDSEKVRALKIKQEIHRQQVTLARKRLFVRECLAKAFPSKFLMFYADGMDIKKSNLPRTRALTHTKGVDQAGEPLDVKLLGLHSVGRGFHGYWVFPHFASNNNVTLTAVLHYFKHVIDSEGSLPPYIFVQFDNSGKDNKSVAMMCFFAYLLVLNLCSVIECHFLPVGHTHALIDQNFSVINRRLGSEDLLSLDAIVDKVKDLFVTEKFYSKHNVFFSVADFNDFFLEFAKDIAGHGTVRINNIKRRLHAFKFEMYQKVPCVVVKEFDEASSSWRGSWQDNSKPLPIFRDLSGLQTRSLRPAPRTPVKNLDKVIKTVNEVHKIVSGGRSLGEATSEDMLYQPIVSWPARFKQTQPVNQLTLDQLRTKLEEKRAEFQGFSTFWRWYFNEQKEFWAASDNSDPRRETNKQFSFPRPRASSVLDKETSKIVALLSTTNLSESKEVEETVERLPKGIRIALKQAVDFELTSKVKEGRDDTSLFLFYKGSPPPARCTYNPVEDCKTNQVAILRVARDTSTSNRGWELGKVQRLHKDRISGKTTVDVWYLAPPDSDWSDGWWEKKLRPIELRSPTGRKLIWADFNRDLVDEVVYSFYLTTTGKIPKKVQQLVRSQTDRIARGFEEGAAGHYGIDILDDEEGLSD